MAFPSLQDAIALHRWKRDGGEHELVRLPAGHLAVVRLDGQQVKGVTEYKQDAVHLAQLVLNGTEGALTVQVIEALAAAVIAAATEQDVSISGQPVELVLPGDPVHSDDLAVGRFASAMKAKLAVAREVLGRGGWDDPAVCTTQKLAKMLLRHLVKGDPVDVANFCMMLHERGERGNGSVLAQVHKRQTDALSNLATRLEEG
ncbi:MAG: hypothetical protein CMF75_08355 [Maricaulis sp.]|nr:hypothetical protein [Maricaulis sp.]